MVILVLNCGSSSIKYQVIDMEAQSSKLLAKGLVERIGLPEGDLTDHFVENAFLLKTLQIYAKFNYGS